MVSEVVVLNQPRKYKIAFPSKNYEAHKVTATTTQQEIIFSKPSITVIVVNLTKEQFYFRLNAATNDPIHLGAFDAITLDIEATKIYYYTPAGTTDIQIIVLQE